MRRAKCFFGFHVWCYSPDRMERACLTCPKAKQRLTENHIMLFGPAYRKMRDGTAQTDEEILVFLQRKISEFLNA